MRNRRNGLSQAGRSRCVNRELCENDPEEEQCRVLARIAR